MKIKQMLRWNWQNSWLSLVIVYAVMVGLCLLSAILVAVVADGDIYFNGLTFSSTVMVFILGIVLFSQSLRFGLATGVSRRSVFWGFGVFILFFALITVAADFLLEKIFGLLVAPTGDLLPQIYEQYIQASSKPAAFISLAVCSLTLKLLAGLSGFFIGGAYYRMNKALKLLVSIGVFSIIRIERNVQLLVPAYDFCIPEKECTGGSDQKPCDLFDKINFPLDEFFPPQIRDFNFDQRPDNGGGCNCGCGR